MTTYRIAVIPGDGIGPEVTAQAVRMLELAAEQFRFSLAFEECLAGGAALDATGEPLPACTLETCKHANAVLLGAVGGPKWEGLPGHLRPERALLGLRSGLGLYINLRPAVLYPALQEASPLHPSLTQSGFDMLIVRELTGGIYFGEHGRRQGAHGEEAFDTECYSVMEVERIGRAAFEMARGRARRLTSVDKANVLESSRLWRETMHRLAKEYPDVAYSDMFVDNAAMQLVRDPAQFDVLVTSNLFGDILSDEASVLCGSIGLLPSASLGAQGGMFEPVHGSAPDLAGKGAANPMAAILSAAMLLRYALGQVTAADALEAACRAALEDGLRTPDIAAGAANVDTFGMATAIAERFLRG